MWATYLRIRREKFVLDDAWAWQRVLWAETGRQLLACALNDSVSPLMARTPFYRTESRLGCWTEPPIAPGPFVTPAACCISIRKAQSRSMARGSKVADQAPSEPLFFATWALCARRWMTKRKLMPRTKPQWTSRPSRKVRRVIFTTIVALPRRSSHLQLGATRDWKRAEPGLSNYAILAMGPRLRYTRGLIRDLKAIEERWNDEALDQTALRHIFPHEPPREEDSAKPSEAQPKFSTYELAQTRFLSTSQRDAVRSSISALVSVITGPPGTGKSEVVAAVLLNQLLRDQPAPFASKNYQALDAVVPRLNGAVEGGDLIIQASGRELAQRQSYLDKLRQLLARPGRADTERHKQLEQRFRSAFDRQEEALRRIAEFTKLEREYAELRERAEATATRLPLHLRGCESLAQWPPEFPKERIEQLEAELREATARPTGFVARIIAWFMRRKRRAQLQAVRDRLRSLLGLAEGTMRWLRQEANLFNVAVSRARAVLHIVGDRNWALASGVPFIEKLARRTLSRETAEPSVDVWQSPWQRALWEALCNAGVESIPEYPIAGRFLDLAVLSPRKLDIEVDGESVHRTAAGGRKDDDHWRDLQLQSLGPTVCRFWVYELREDMAGCVRRIFELSQFST